MPTIVEGDFEWDSNKAEENLRKHGVSFFEALTAFYDERASVERDELDPERLILIGMSNRPRVLFVVHLERGERVRIISARVASAAQARAYDEEG